MTRFHQPRRPVDEGRRRCGQKRPDCPLDLRAAGRGQDAGAILLRPANRYGKSWVSVAGAKLNASAAGTFARVARKVGRCLNDEARCWKCRVQRAVADSPRCVQVREKGVLRGRCTK